MKSIPGLLASVLLLPFFVLAQSAKDNSLTDKEKQDGWQLLFDGNSSAGWHVYGKPASSGVWKVANESLHMDISDKTDPAGDLLTDGVYGNFDLKLDWKISKNGNSGVMFDVVEDPKYQETYVTGPEMQVLDNEGHPDGKIKKHRAGDLYDLISSSSEPVKPVGEWNHVEIKHVKGQLDLFLNGVKVVSTVLWDDHWWSLVNGSKFKSMPGFSRSKSGRIALQDHGNEVWFKNIRIKSL